METMTTMDATIVASDTQAMVPTEVMADEPMVPERIHALTNEALFEWGERACGKVADFADDLAVLVEIRQRFRAANGAPLMSYSNWAEFVTKNSHYSLRTIQRRIAEAVGPDESKINTRFKGEPQTCKECGEPFSSKTKLKKHVHKMHPEVVAYTPLASQLPFVPTPGWPKSEVAPAEPEPETAEVVPAAPVEPAPVEPAARLNRETYELRKMRSWIKKNCPDVMIQIQLSKLGITRGSDENPEPTFYLALENISIEETQAVCQTLQKLAADEPPSLDDALKADSQADVFCRKLRTICEAIESEELRDGEGVVARLQVLEEEKKQLWDEISRGSQLLDVDAENVRLFPDGSVLDDDATYRSLEEYTKETGNHATVSKEKEQSETRPLVVTSFPKTKIRRKAASGRIRKTKAASGCIRKTKAASGRRRKKTNGKGVRQ
jgi:hypothetical protein